MDYNNYLNRDYKKVSSGEEGTRVAKLQRRHLHLLAAGSLALGLFALLTPGHEAEATRQITQVSNSSVTPAQAEEKLLQLPLSLPTPSNSTDNTSVTRSAEESVPWERVTVESGDTLSLIFDRLHLTPQQLHAVLSLEESKSLVTGLRPKQTLQFQIHDNALLALRYDRTPTETLLIQRDGEGFQSHLLERPVEIRLTHASGEINNSLFAAGQRAGLSDNIIMELAEIFGWDIDFALDIRSGDHFSLLFEEHYLEGEKLRDGKILAAEFVNQGTSYRAVLFTDPQGNSQYYSEDGRSMRKAFLRSPVDFRRISSTFQRERFHPVLGKKRPHKGVDYAAATGTPIKAAGDGKVIFRGVKGGYGNVVILQHGNNITTLYGHMSKFQKGVTNGSRVRQGQTIGYVGKTGVATGPHLHYEFRINGVHRNPLTVALPDAAPVPSEYREAFKVQSQQLLAQLDLFKRVQVAANNNQ